jgi:DNA-binding MarR family transcriptional regulator
MVLAFRGLPRHDETTIRLLVSRVALTHHSAVELVDQLEEHGYVRRSRGQKDRRLVMVSPLPSGERLLKEMVRRRVGELRSNGHRRVLAIHQILASPRQPQDFNRGRNQPRRRVRDKRG